MSDETTGAKRRNLLVVVLAIPILGVATWLLVRAMPPPLRAVVFVVNGSPSEAVATAGGQALGSVAGGGWRRFEVRARETPVHFSLKSGDGELLRCDLAEGVHVANASDDYIKWELVRYVSEHSTLSGIGVPKPQYVVRGCKQISDDVGSIVYGFDETPPEIVSATMPTSLPENLRTETRIQLSRKPPGEHW